MNPRRAAAAARTERRRVSDREICESDCGHTGAVGVDAFA
jgi:hypothetical protein